MHTSRVPPFFGVPSAANAAPPSRIIAGIALNVSTLFNSVGKAHARDRRERRLHARDAALAFERIEQRRFFAALVGARARMRVEIEIETRAAMFLPR